MRNELKPKTWPEFSNNEISNVIKVLKSKKVNYWTGNECLSFEKEFKNKFNLKNCSTIANGSLALDCAVRALNIKKGDEVIVTPRSYISSVSCVINQSAKPIFVDININSHNIDPDLVEKKINKKTRAIICVHLAGFPCDMLKINSIAKKNNIYVIEDCSQAHGAKIGKKYVGSFGDISIWSFCNDKIISTGGEGAIISVKNNKIFNKVLSIKDCGKNFDKISKLKNDIGFKWVHDSIGTNMRLTEIQAAIGRYQLKKLDQWNKKRKFNAHYIWNQCQKIKNVIVPHVPKNFTHAGYRCIIRIDIKKLKTGWSRNRIITKLKKNNINCSVGSCPEIYLEKYFVDNQLMPKKRLINAKLVGEQSIAFEINHNQTISYIKKIPLILKKILLEAS